MAFSIVGCRETKFSIARGLNHGQNYPWETQVVCGGGGGEREFSKICQQEVATHHSGYLDMQQMPRLGKAFLNLRFLLCNTDKIMSPPQGFIMIK